MEKEGEEDGLSLVISTSLSWAESGASTSHSAIIDVISLTDSISTDTVSGFILARHAKMRNARSSLLAAFAVE
ncbi:MAG: hypothetical protein NWR39_01325 [Pseudomonadota bacterium]|jgi:hypothetical protein|nr:hypothetical protein [Alphaproteobacteria bacterium]MDP5370200.1 hypothetical protein [Pseudomonadota bacterium]